MVHVAMDGQSLYNTTKVRNESSENKLEFSKPITPTGAEVAQNIKQSIEEIKADTQQLQKMSEMVTGRKLQFNVNKDLGSVIITIVDSNTNQILKEIPSKDIQKLKIRIRKQIGSIIDQFS